MAPLPSWAGHCESLYQAYASSPCARLHFQATVEGGAEVPDPGSPSPRTRSGISGHRATLTRTCRAIPGGPKLDHARGRRYGAAMRRAWAVLLVAAVAAAASAARHAPLTSPMSPARSTRTTRSAGHFRVRYDHTEQRAQIKREFEGLSPTQESIAVLRDLLYAQSRDTLTLRAEIGLFQDLMLTSSCRSCSPAAELRTSTISRRARPAASRPTPCPTA